MTYYENKLNEYKHNMKKLWSFINTSTGKTKDNHKYPQNFIINDKNVSNRDTIAESFNTFFTNVGKETNQQIPSVDKNYTSYLPDLQPNSLFVNPVNELEILKLVSKLKPKTSYGYDTISPYVLKKTIHYILEPFTHIINRSLATGIFPTQMKTARLIPLYKNSDNQQITNYRPISLLSTFFRILERVMYNRLISFFKSKKILYKHQYEFLNNTQQFIQYYT